MNTLGGQGTSANPSCTSAPTHVFLSLVLSPQVETVLRTEIVLVDDVV